MNRLVRLALLLVLVALAAPAAASAGPRMWMGFQDDPLLPVAARALLHARPGDAGERDDDEDDRLLVQRRPRRRRGGRREPVRSPRTAGRISTSSWAGRRPRHRGDAHDLGHAAGEAGPGEEPLSAAHRRPPELPRARSRRATPAAPGYPFVRFYRSGTSRTSTSSSRRSSRGEERPVGPALYAPSTAPPTPA